MKFAAVHLAFMRDGAAARASAAALGTWTRLYVRAAELEKAGVIPGAAAFDERAWIFAAGVTRAEVDEAVASELCAWRGRDLAVHGYDLAGQRIVESKRRNGERGGRPVKPNDITVGKPNGSRVGQPLFSPLPSSPLPILPITESSEPAQTPPSEPAVMTFPTVGTGAKTWPLTAQQRAAWVEAFPGVDVRAELSAALAWLAASPERRKTAKGMPRFLVNWFGRAKDRGGRPANGVAAPARESFEAIREREARERAELGQREIDSQVSATSAKFNRCARHLYNRNWGDCNPRCPEWNGKAAVG